MSRFFNGGQDLCKKNAGTSSAPELSKTRMISQNRYQRHLILEHNTHFIGVRLLSRASFVLIVATATIVNDADQSARAVGLISIRIDGSPFGLRTHACMQPSDGNVPDEPAPPEPPCPKIERK
jgi:hypothetical protein